MNAKSIELIGYKRLHGEETPLPIQKGVNLLVGQNGSGKSSLLEYLWVW
jgi:recombinational DNA repair ATPase RecF